MSELKTVIIGAGFGGMAAAALLAKKGFDVTVVEKNDQPGGRAIVYKEKGFVFDMGPSWYLMPDVFETFFKEFNTTSDKYYKLLRLNPAYRVFYSKDEHVDILPDFKEVIKVFDTYQEDGGEQLKKYLDAAEYQYDIAMREFIYKEYDHITDFLNRKLLLEGSKLHIFTNLDDYAKRYIPNDKLRKILEYTMVFLGGTPFDTPALYSLMSHVDFKLGVWYPDGGMGAFVQGMYKLAKEQGVTFRFNEEVKKINVKDKKVAGIKTTKGSVPADIIIANADYPHVETELLDPEYQSYPKKFWEKKAIAPSAILMYLGIDKKLKNLKHHTLYFDPHWEHHFETIIKKPSWPDNPSYYVCCPSKTDDSVAPKGKENLFILVPVAAGLDDTDEIREHYYEKTLTHLEELIGENIRDHVIVKRLFSHRDFKDMYHAYKGTALGYAHTLKQTAVFRPKHKSKKVKGLYYTGHYTHPGIGVPIVIISSQILAEQLTKTYVH